MSRRLKEDIPGPDWRRPPEALKGAAWAEEFREQAGVSSCRVVEIGFGRGEFLMSLAENEPETNFVGVEYSRKRIFKFARRLACTKIGNLRLVDCTGEHFVEECLEPNTIDAFWINISDPWPKKRHHRRRLLQPSFIKELAIRLKRRGKIEIATDHIGYAQWIDQALSQEDLLENMHAPQPYLADVPGRKPTAYELEWRAEGRSLHFWTYQKR